MGFSGGIGRVNVGYSATTPRYFETVGIPLLLGRQFTDRDSAGAPDVAIINETAARRLWPDESPLGKRFMFGGQNRTADGGSRRHQGR
jgi:hypothetical protein